MLEQLLFFESVRAAASNLRMVEQVDACDDPDQVNVEITDFLPGEQGKPWVIEVRRSDAFVHPLFGDHYPCIELSLPVTAVQPIRPGYLELVAATAAPCLDHQRFVFGASVQWEPDSGQIGIYSQVRLRGESQATLVCQLGDELRNVAALAYLLSFRIWQLELRRQQPESETSAVIAEAHQRMLDLLGASPPSV